MPQLPLRPGPVLGADIQEAVFLWRAIRHASDASPRDESSKFGIAQKWGAIGQDRLSEFDAEP